MDFVGIAYAMAPSPGNQGGSAFGPLLPILGIFVIFYFMLIRPQHKRQQEHRQMLARIRKGDRVITTGGIYGTVEKVKDQTVILEISDKVRVELSKGAIQGISSTSES